MKYWVFDLDGTLIDSHGAYFISLKHVLERYGSELTEEDQREVLKISVKNRPEFFIRKLGEASAQEAMSLLDRRLEEDHRRVSPYSGVTELLESLKARNTEVALWTARDLNSAVQVLKHLGLHHYFSICVGSTCLTHCKPHPEGLQRVARHFDCLPEELFMVGDHENDLLAARACGAKAIQAMWHNPQGVTPSLHADQSFREIQALQSWISQS